MEIVQLIREHPVLSLAQTAFMIWMLVDAYRRRAEYYWFWIILLVPGLGAWAYFFAVKASDFRGANLGQWFQRPPSLDELRYKADQFPTLANRLALAQRLTEKGEHADAVPLLEAVLKQESEHATALYTLAVCHKAQAKCERAVPLLEKLLARDAAWSNYAAWRLLIEAKDLLGDEAGALDSCRRLVRLAPSLHHHCLLAEHLLGAGLNDEAEFVLRQSLQEHAYAPRYVRRRDARWAGEARRLQKQIPAKG